MIPPNEKILTPAERARWQLTKVAASLVRDHGVSPDVVMLDAREGVDHAAAYVRQRAARGAP